MRRTLLLITLLLATIAVACSDDNDSETADSTGGDTSGATTTTDPPSTDGTDVTDVDGADGGSEGGSASFCGDILSKLDYLAQQDETQFADDQAFIEANIGDEPPEVQEAMAVIIAAEQAVVSDGDTSLRMAPEYTDAQAVIADRRAEVC